MSSLDEIKHILVIPFVKYRELLASKNTFLNYLKEAGISMNATKTIKFDRDDVIIGQTICELKEGISVTECTETEEEEIERLERNGLDSEHQKDEEGKDNENY